MCEVATFLKVGTTAIVLKMIEDRFLPDLSLQNPVAALHAVSRDITLHGRPCRSPTAGELSAVQLQWEYFEHAKKYVEREDDTAGEPGGARRDGRRCSSALETEPLSLHRELDWVAKYRLLDRVPRARRAGVERSRSSRRSTCSTTTSVANAACTTGSTPAARWSA